MQPNDQPPTSGPTPPSGQFDPNQFDFIMNPSKPAKKSLLPPMSPKTRMLVFAGAGIFGAILIILVLLALFSGGPGASEDLIKITQRQNEIMRVAALGNQKAGGSSTKKLAAITSSTVTSDQAQTIAYLERQKTKVNEKQLRELQDRKTDDDLKAAESNGRFDEVFTRILLEQLSTYSSELEAVFPKVGTNGKELLDRNYKNVQLILKDNPGV